MADTYDLPTLNEAEHDVQPRPPSWNADKSLIVLILVVLLVAMRITNFFIAELKYLIESMERILESEFRDEARARSTQGSGHTCSLDQLEEPRIHLLCLCTSQPRQCLHASRPRHCGRFRFEMRLEASAAPNA